MPCAFIDDGYTEETAIAESPGLYPQVRLSFRPMTASEHAEYAQAVDTATETEMRQVSAAWIARKIVAWDLRDPHGATVPLTTDNVLRLKVPIFVRLLEVVSCTTPGDALHAERNSKN
jgi:hypothetical protein